MTPLVDIALMCLKRGWFVFPCYPRSKAPAGEVVPHGWKEASNDEAQIRAWWARNPNYNPAIALEQSGLVVYDFDEIAPFPNLPPTFTVKTGRVPVNGVDGIQMYYTGSCKTHTHPGGSGEVRSRGAYVMAPGSVHPSGNLYKVVLNGPLAPSPEQNEAEPVVLGEAVGTDEQNTIAAYVEAAFDVAGIDYKARTAKEEGGFMWLIACPWRGEHTSGKDFDTSSVVIMWSSGKLIYECKHSHCMGIRQWKQLREFMEQKVGNRLVFGDPSHDTLILGGKIADPKPVLPDTLEKRRATSLLVFEHDEDVEAVKNLNQYGLGAFNVVSLAEIQSSPANINGAVRVVIFGKGEKFQAARHTIVRTVGDKAIVVDLPPDYDAKPGKTVTGKVKYPPVKVLSESKERLDDMRYRGAREIVAWLDEQLNMGAVKDAGTKSALAPASAAPTVAEPKVDSRTIVRPVFPLEVMEGTNLYRLFVKPVWELSQKVDYFLFLSGAQVCLNFLARQVRIAKHDSNLNLFLGFISPPGAFYKSSACEAAYKFAREMQICDKYRTTMTNESANGKILIAGGRSPEGVLSNLSRVGANRAILFHDELAEFVKKAGIECSTYAETMLTLYEGGEVQGNVKSRRDSYTLEAGTYTYGWQFCTVEKGFKILWSKLTAETSGFDDRMFFALSPEEQRKAGLHHLPNLADAATEMRRLLAAALTQQTYTFESIPEAQKYAAECVSARAINLLLAFALFFAADAGKQVIDGECLRKAAAIIRYREEVYAYLAPQETRNVLAEIQMEIVDYLKKRGGQGTLKKLRDGLHWQKYGTEQWKKALGGLVGEGIIRIDHTSRPKMVFLLEDDD
jgi:hypothetical protein